MPDVIRKLLMNFMASVYSSLPIGAFFALVWTGGPNYGVWSSSGYLWVVSAVAMIIVLLLYRLIAIKIWFKSEQETKDFDGNFISGIFAGILVSLAIIYHLWFNQLLWHPIDNFVALLGALVAPIVIFLIVLWTYSALYGTQIQEEPKKGFFSKLFGKN